ncbi:hypothetical protein HY932_01000 [Candidatus Falkowbacteria bacterium]|nr:hypothetical protein [Candidatus Falkowbacteria bacterium]
MSNGKKWKLSALIVLAIVCLTALVVCWAAIFAFTKKTGNKLNLQKTEIAMLEKCDIRTKFPVTKDYYQEFKVFGSHGFLEDKVYLFYWVYKGENGILANGNGEFVAIDLKTCEKVWALATKKSINSVDGVRFSFDAWDAQFGYLVVGNINNEEYNGATIYKVQLVNGQALWQYSFEKGEVAAIEVAEKQILIGVKKHWVATGCEECTKQQADELWKVLAAKAGENVLLAINKETGKLSWKYKIKTTNDNWSFATDGFDKVFVAATTLKLDINTGKIK